MISSSMTSLRSASFLSRRVNCRTFVSVISQKAATTSNIRSRLCTNSFVRNLSTDGTSGAKTEESSPIILFEGAFSTKLRCLRVVSFGSSIFCTFGLPLGLALNGTGGSIPFVGQVLIASTAMLISYSSTAFLQLVTHPYTIVLKEIPQPVKEGEVTDFDKRVFRATRIGVYGQLKETEFTMKDTARVTTSAHPFASVKIKGSFFYIFGANMTDIPLRHGLTNEK